jgi:hypothetical protein
MCLFNLDERAMCARCEPASSDAPAEQGRQANQGRRAKQRRDETALATEKVTYRLTGGARALVMLAPMTTDRFDAVSAMLGCHRPAGSHALRGAEHAKAPLASRRPRPRGPNLAPWTLTGLITAAMGRQPSAFSSVSCLSTSALSLL